RLAVAALGHVLLEPGPLDRVAPVGRQALDRRDAGAGRVTDGELARTGGAAVDVHRAGAADPDAAAVLGPSQAQPVAQDPTQRHLGGSVDVARRAVDAEAAGGQRATLTRSRPFRGGTV